MRFRVPFAFVLTLAISQAPRLHAQQTSPLRSLDNSARAIRMNQSLPSSGLSDLLGGARSEQVRGLGLRTEIQTLFAGPSAFMSVRSKKELNDHQVAMVYNDWLATINAKSPTISGEDVHKYRRFLSLIAPHLIPLRDGQVSGTLSPAEALYVIDAIFAAGKVPMPTETPGVGPVHLDAAPLTNDQSAYIKAVQTYRKKTSAADRQAWFRAELRQIPAFSQIGK